MKDILQSIITFRKEQKTLRNILEQHVQVQIFGAIFHFTKKIPKNKQLMGAHVMLDRLFFVLVEFKKNRFIFSYFQLPW